MEDRWEGVKNKQTKSFLEEFKADVIMDFEFLCCQ